MGSAPGEPPSDAGVPTCYRHPDRETYIRCSRCARPICPDCMTPASVGFQCPECIRAGNAGQRHVRTAFGGRPTAGAAVTMAIIGVNVAVFLLQLGTDRMRNGVTDRFELWANGVAINDEYYRLVTAPFLHGGIIHIAFNMYMLYLFGQQLEQVLGRWRFLALYLLSALGGSAASFVFNHPNTLSLGASGAVFGLVGAYFMVARRLNRDTSWLVGLLLINALLPLITPNIDWHAHVGGFLTGLLGGAVLAYTPRAHRTSLQTVGLLVLLALIVMADLARIGDLRSAFGL